MKSVKAAGSAASMAFGGWWKLVALVMAYAVFGALVAACGVMRHEDARLAVIGGDVADPVRYGSAVALVSEGENIYCSGVLLTPSVVATAAHCLRGHEPYADHIRVYYGPGSSTGKVHDHLVAVKSGGFEPRYNAVVNPFGQFDVGYLVLASPLAMENLVTTAAPLADYDEMAALLREEVPVTIAAFGCRRRDLDCGVGEKRSTDLRVNVMKDVSFHVGEGQLSVWYGDSGGPVYGQAQDGSLRVLGVVSQGEGDGAYISYLYPSLCWMARASGETIPGADQHCYERFDATASGEALDFVAACQAPRDSFQARTIAMIKQRAGMEDCEQLVAWAAQQSTLDLGRSYLLDLAPLKIFSHLQTLSLAENPLRNLQPLWLLKELRTLRLSLNRVDQKAWLAYKAKAPQVRIQVDDAAGMVWRFLPTLDASLFADVAASLPQIEMRDDKDKRTVLLQAVWQKRRDLVEILLAAGADVNAVDGLYGHSALMLAVIKDDVAMGKLLLEHGVDQTIKNKWHASAWSMAVQDNNKKFLALLTPL